MRCSLLLFALLLRKRSLLNRSFGPVKIGIVLTTYDSNGVYHLNPFYLWEGTRNVPGLAGVNKTRGLKNRIFLNTHMSDNVELEELPVKELQLARTCCEL